MTTLLLTKTVLAMLVMTIQATSNWNQTARNYIRKIHNDYRRGEGGCMMNKLIYDNELERQAKQKAEGCVFKREMIKGRGENLFWNMDLQPEKEMILESTSFWFDEQEMYTYGQSSCESSCQYTQMVWASTSKMGCYSYICPNLVNVNGNAWYLVCFYSPMGNTKGDVPYVKATICKSKCREGQTEEKGLCVGVGKGGNINQGGDDEGCFDDHGGCTAWASDEHCMSDRYMLKYCRKSCKVCGRNTSCEDVDSRCSYWASQNYCKDVPDSMLENCKHSCQTCNSENSCVDFDYSCENYAKNNYCNSFYIFMSKTCKKSCKMC